LTVRKVVSARFSFNLNIRRSNRPSATLTYEHRTALGPNTRPAASNSSGANRLLLVSKGQISLNTNGSCGRSKVVKNNLTSMAFPVSGWIYLSKNCLNQLTGIYHRDG